MNFVFVYIPELDAKSGDGRMRFVDLSDYSEIARILPRRQNTPRETSPAIDAAKEFNGKESVLSNEDNNAFKQLLEMYWSEFAPTTQHEEFLICEMATARWKLARLQQMENAMFAAFDNPADLFMKPSKAFNLIQRYRSRHERAYNAAVRKLRAAKKAQRKPNSK